MDAHTVSSALFVSLLLMIPHVCTLSFVAVASSAEVMAGLRDFLSPQAVLVGQSIHKDVQWLQLAEGIDYHSMINLSDLFRVWNAPRKAYTNFSQDHCAKVWLGMQERPHHDALTDATVSMSLFNMYRQLQIYPQQMLDMRQRTLDAPRIPGFSKKFPSIDGCW